MNRIAELRKKAGLTQKELAEQLNINPVTLSRYETGDRQPSFETLNRLSEIFNYASASYIMGLVDEVQPIEVSYTEDNLFRTLRNIYELEQEQQHQLLQLLSTVERLQAIGDKDALKSLAKTIELLFGIKGLYSPDTRFNVFSEISKEETEKKKILKKSLGSPRNSVKNYFSLSQSLKKETDSFFLNKFNEHYNK